MHEADEPYPEGRGVGVSLVNVTKRFDAGSMAVLSEISIDFRAGEFAAILGASGSGKSTLLRLIAGLDRPSFGDVTVGAQEPGSAASDRRPKVAYVFQDAHLLPWRTVVDNVQLPLELQRVPRVRRHAAAMTSLEQVGLADAAGRYPNQLSGGMRMRVSLARALVTDPQLLLLDEPFAALDEITRQRLDEQLRQLWLTHRMTTLFVTHSTAEAVFLADRAVVLSARPAEVIADQRIDLPPDRTGPLRGTADFAAQTRRLYEALERGAVAGTAA